MTNAGMFEDAEEIEKLEKTIDTLETQNDIKDYHINKLKEEIKELQEALDSSKRAISRAQLTKSGHVYVISNIGSAPAEDDV